LSWATEWNGARFEHALRSVEALVQSGQVDVNSRDYNGYTPLIYAIRTSNIKVVEYLLTLEQIDPDSRDNDGRSPLSWAASNMAMGIRSLQFLRLLLQSDRVDPDSRDIQGRSPLSWAAQSGNIWFMKILDQTNKTVEIDSRDNQGRTPLWWAAWSFQKDMTLCLLRTGKANPEFTNNTGTTILDPKINKLLEEWKQLYVE
jgi:ankyrin repeat protein